MKILFLDIDGVVCLHDRERGINFSDGGADDVFNPDCCRRLKTIIDRTGCKLVLSSSWRETRHDIENMLTQLRPHGVTQADFAGKTPSLGSRESEVLAYLRARPADTFIAVDDEDFCRGAFPPDRFVHTDERYGITDEVMHICIAKLNG